MRQECSTTPVSTPSVEDCDENSFEEPVAACLRRELGLRPIHYSDDVDTRKEGHPDQRPCPSWCWVGQHEEYGHEIDSSRPMEAFHSMDATPSVVASLYPGEPARGNDRLIKTATVEPRLGQIGQHDPVVKIALRQWNGGEQVFTDELLRLTIADARELVAALEYLIQTAKRR